MSSCNKRKRDPEKIDIREFLGILALFLIVIWLGFLGLIFWIRDKIKILIGALIHNGVKCEEISGL